MDEQDVRRRLYIAVDNPFISSDEDIVNYNAVCEMVKKYGVNSLLIKEDYVEVSVYALTVKYKYPKRVELSWLEEKMKYTRDKNSYNENAKGQGVEVRNRKWSKGIRNAIQYALSLDCKVETKNDNIVLTTETLEYSLNLNFIAFEEREEVNAMFSLRRLEILAKKHNLYKKHENYNNFKIT